MALKASVTNVDFTASHLIVKGKITATGSYPGTPDTLSLAGLDGVESVQVPDWVEIMEAPAATSTASGLVYQFLPGTTQANGKVEVLVSGANGAVLSQLGNVTYASVVAANIVFKAEFKRL